MTLASFALPFGLRQVLLTPILADGTLDTTNSKMLPASRTFTFKVNQTFATLDGDDVTIASHGGAGTVAWDLEGGGISLDIYKILAGGTIASTGTTPAVVRSFTQLNTDSRPYFQVKGRAISDSGGDFACEVFRCKADGSLDGELSNGNFALTKASGTGFGDASGVLYKFSHEETAVPLVAGV